MPRRKATFDKVREVRAIARERVGAVPSSRVIEEKKRRKKPKYKRPIDINDPVGGEV